ncbi:MAG TPA: phage portal protein [Terriglobales bacterium]|nr:phage portal protein [Terriglobales bacterium]
MLNRLKAALRAFIASADTTTLVGPAPWFQESLLALPTASGRLVSPETAMRASAVLACIRILSEDVSTLPLRLFVRTKTGAQYAFSHPVFDLLYSSPNDEMTAVELREHMVIDSLLYGGFYNLLEIDGSGDIRAITPLAASNVIPRRNLDTKKLEFLYNPPNTPNGPAMPPTVYQAEQVWRGQMLSRYGITGQSVCLLAREAIGLALAAEEQGARLFSNGTQVTGFLSTPPGVELTADQRTAIATGWKDAYGGSANSFKTAILQNGLTYQKLSLTAQESQFIEARKFQLQEIARLFRVPAVMLGANDKEQTYASAEAFFSSYVRNTLLPWTTRIEQSITRDLLRPDERSRFYARHNFNSLMRADTLQRYQAYGQAIRDGWLSRNEVRDLEELADQPGLDEFLVPLNTGTQAADGTITAPSQKVQAVLTAAAGRIVRREAKSKKFEPEFVAETLALPIETAQAYCTKREAGAITEGDAITSLVKLALEAA